MVHVPTYAVLQDWLKQNKSNNDVPHNRDLKLVVVDNWVWPSWSAGRRKGSSTSDDP
jgi:hypothetical protein